MSLPTWLPWADRQDWGRRGPGFRDVPVSLVLHSTEGSSWPSYSGGAVQPHLTIKWRGPKRRGFTVRQHQPLNVGARALSDSPASPCNCVADIQVEIIGSCDKGYAEKYDLLWLPGAGDEFLADLGAFIVKLSKACGFQLAVTDEPWTDTNAAYPGAPQRMTFPAFEAFPGICAHQHAPAPNSHWDVGVTNVRRSLELAGASAGVIGSEDGVLAFGDSGRKVRRLQRKLNRKYGADLEVDGVFGANTKAAVERAQRLLRVGVDGAWGPVTAKADRTFQEDVKREHDRASRGKPRRKPAHRKPFPLPRGHAYARNDWTRWTHSGYRRRDRDEIRDIQHALNGDGAHLAVDGRFGRRTKAAVEAFQRRHHLTVDGEVGPATWAALF